MAKPIQVVVHLYNGVLCRVYADNVDVVVVEVDQSDDEETSITVVDVCEMDKSLEELLQELAG